MKPSRPPKPPKRILFILKRGNAYGKGKHYHRAAGLRNSAQFVVDALVDNRVIAKLVEVIDNNDIDREVHAFRPDIVIIEAFWVVPEKFDVLHKLHPNVQWIIRAHSDFPFLAAEGIAIEWIRKYLTHPKVWVSFNKQRVIRDLKELYPELKEKFIYLPNIYPSFHPQFKCKHPTFNVGCFGAIRPLKNTLIQAVAAMRYADETGKTLNFFVNASRCEQDGENALRNVEALFANTRHRLIGVRWLEHRDFLTVMNRMDLAMSVSFSETFCITAADAAIMSVPLVCSNQVPWASGLSTVDDITDSEDILSSIRHVLREPFKSISLYLNSLNLAKFSQNSTKIWLSLVRPEPHS